MNADTTRTTIHTREQTGFRLLWLATLLALVALLPGLAYAQDAAEDEAQNDEATQEAQAQQGDPVVLEVGTMQVTRSEFDERFDIAARTLAAQQGLEPTEENLAQFDPQREAFLDQLATQLALLNEAEEQGITVSDEEVDQALEQFQGQFDSDEAFQTQIADLGFEDVDELRSNIRENLRVQALVDFLSTDIAFTEAELRGWYDANPEQFETEGGETVPFEDAQAQIENFLTQQEVGQQVQDIRAEADVQSYPENL